MRKLKILIIMVFMFAVCVNAFAAIPVVTGDEPEPPKVVITENDKMTLRIIGSYRVPIFTFLDQDYDYKENFKEVSILFEASGMSDWYKNYRKAYEKKNNILDSEDYLSNSVKRFNDYLAQAKENREKIAEVIKAKLPAKWEKIQKNKELIGNRELKFMGFNLGFGLHPGRRYDLTSGVGYWYFNSNMNKSFNYGISINANFSFQGKSFSNTYSYTNTADKCGYLNLNGNFLLKFGKFNSYIWGLGFDVSVKLTKAEHYTFKDTYYGLKFENGFLYLKNNLSWGLYFTIYVKLLFYQKTTQPVMESDTPMSFALGFQTTFLLNLTGK